VALVFRWPRASSNACATGPLASIPTSWITNLQIHPLGGALATKTSSKQEVPVILRGSGGAVYLPKGRVRQRRVWVRQEASKSA